jgi:hypothetical protein
MAYNVAELRLCYQALCLCTDKLLLKLNNLGTLWLLVLQLGNLVRHLQSR